MNHQLKNSLIINVMEKLIIGLFLMIVGVVFLAASLTLIKKYFHIPNRNLMFNVGDRVYMDSQLGRYIGTVIAADEKIVTITYFPLGGGNEIIKKTVYVKENIWKKL